MANFSSTCLNIIEDFATSLKINIRPVETNHLSLDCGDLGLVSFYATYNDRDLVLGMERNTLDYHDTNLWLSLLKMAGFDPELRAYVNAGLTRDNSIILFARYDMNDFSYQQLQIALDRIAKLHDTYAYNLSAS